MSCPTQAYIHLDAIRHNYRYAKQLAPHSRAIAIIKANAYGHGAIPVARALEHDADAFGVACLTEALELRESHIQTPIVLLEGLFSPADIAIVDAAQLILVIHNQQQITWLLAARPHRRLHVFLKIDTGMHRLGLAPNAFAAAYAALAQCPHIKNITLMSHFACADELDNPFTQQQINCFQDITQHIQAPRSLANSAGILAWPQAHGHWIRPGIMLYGASPLTTAIDNSSLQPVMHLRSEIIAVQNIQAGDTIGYGRRYVCEKNTRIGVVAIGYGDGYPRHAIDGTSVTVNGQKTQLIGRVSMDMLTVDITNIPEADIGAEVELWGAKINVNHVAEQCATIAYTLLSGLTQRVKRVYLNVS
jgi:alanine racemase